ncbi:hypothetical protein V3C99_013994, partial [Haemonchus contortus]
ITHPYNSNDAHIWTTKDPDLELVEPRILVSINRNYLVYGRKFGRPPQTHKIILVNHGENPVAFKVLTTDNYAYFVNQVFGVIPGRHLHAIPHLRAPNQFTLQVFRRPYDCFCDEQQPSHWNTPRKDKLFILLAPVFSFSIPPASVFHHEGAYEKLRICLEYTGMPVDPDKDVSLIFKKFPGWCTWKVERKKDSFELLGKNREEARKMIKNIPSRLPLVFEEIPEVLPVDVSKKKKALKDRRKKKEEKAKVVDVPTPFDLSPVKVPTERHVGRFAGKLARERYQEGKVRQTKSSQETPHKERMLTKLSEETSKLLQLGHSQPVQMKKEESVDVTPDSATTSAQLKTDRTKAESPDMHTGVQAERSKSSIIKDLKAMLDKRSREVVIKSDRSKEKNPKQ